MADLEDAFSSAARDFAGPLRLPPPPPPTPAALAAAASPVPAAAAPSAASPAAPAAASAAPAPPAPPSPAAAATASSAATAASPLAPDAAGARSKSDTMVLHQATRAQLQAVRSLAHRAAHTMETWRVATGSRQITELFYYFSTFVDCVARSVKANEVLLAFVRASSAACATWAGALAAAAATLEPLSTGELMSSPAGGSAAAAAAAASAAAAAAAASGGGAGGALSPSRIALGIEKPQLPSLGQLTRQLQVLQGALCTLGGDLAASISKMLAGDADGPLGRHAGSSARRLAQGASESSAPPGDMASLTAWYSACASDLKDKGSALGAQLTEAQGQCEKAYAELDGLCSAHLSGDPRRVASVKGRCLWAAELRYRRACRALLGVKSRYLAHMAALFEKFRGVEAARSEAMGACLEAYSCLIARSFERAGGGSSGGGGGSGGGGAAGGAPNGVPALAQALNTHQDLCRVVDAEARVKILELRQAAERAGLVGGGGGGGGGSAAGAGAVGAAAAAAAQAELAQSPAEQHQLLHTVYREAALSSVAAAASAAPGAAAGAAAAAPVTFRLDPAPAVISPLASPLVLRCGMLYRQSGIVKAWKPVVAVLTRDGHLHLFAPEEDVATHPDLLAAMFRSTISTGFGGTSREVYNVLSARRGAEEGGAAAPAAEAASALPPPALPHVLQHYALQLAARVDDMAVAPPRPAGGSGSAAAAAPDAAAARPEPIALLRKCAAAARHGFVFTPTSRLGLLPALHSAAFQVFEERGFFGGGSAKVVLRGLGDQDAREWAHAIGLLLDTLVPVLNA